MNKAYLLTICLLFASFTGCVDNSNDDDLTSEIENLTNQTESLNELLTNQTEDNDALTSDIAKLNEQLANQTEENDNLIEQVQNNAEDNSELPVSYTHLTLPTKA